MWRAACACLRAPAHVAACMLRAWPALSHFIAAPGKPCRAWQCMRALLRRDACGIRILRAIHSLSLRNRLLELLPAQKCTHGIFLYLVSPTGLNGSKGPKALALSLHGCLAALLAVP